MLLAAPAAHGFSEAPTNDMAASTRRSPSLSLPNLWLPRLSLPRLSLYAGNFSTSTERHPGRLSSPPGTALRWGPLGPDRDGGMRFGARLSGPGGTWTLDHSDGHWRGATAHRFRLGFSRRF
jgi:hypothetical protein